MTVQSSNEPESNLLPHSDILSGSQDRQIRSRYFCRMFKALHHLKYSPQRLPAKVGDPAGGPATLLATHTFHKTKGQNGQVSPRYQFSKLMHSSGAGTHSIKITISGKATASLLSLSNPPSTHPLFLKELLRALTKERDPL